MRWILALFRFLASLLLFPLRLPVFLFYRLTLLRKKRLLHVRFPDRFSLFESGGWMERLTGIGGEEVNYFRFLLMLRRTAMSPEIKTVITEFPPGLDEALDWSQACEIADELDRIRNSGKKLITHATGGGLRTLLLLSRGEERLASPGAHFLTALPHAEPMYFADLLRRVGVTVEVYHAGRFKSAGEALSRTGPSTAARENLTTLLRGMRSLFAGRLQASPVLDADQKRALMRLLESQSICTPDELGAIGFLGGLVESSALVAHATGQPVQPGILHKFGGPGDTLADEAVRNSHGPQAMDALQFLKREARRQFSLLPFRRTPAVALAVMSGTIVQGKDGDSARAGNVVAAAWRPLLEELAESDEEAVFVYIDSPGGMSDASEALYQDLRKLSRIKPVFAVMGGVAASGGYYIACAANRIYASPTTITGSIGVIRMRPQASGLLKRLHIRSERIQFDETTDILSLTDRPGRRSRRLLEKNTASTYMDFLRRVSEGRGLSLDHVQKHAEGRVYLAAELHESGLLDGIQGIIPLLERFRQDAGYGPHRPIEVRILPELRFDLRRALRSGLPFAPRRGAAEALSDIAALFPSLSAPLSLLASMEKPLYLLPFRPPFTRHH